MRPGHRRETSLASAKTWFSRAVTAHREGLGLLNAVRERLGRLEFESAHIPQSQAEQAALVEQLRSVAATLGSGWLGTDWADLTIDRFPLGSQELAGGVALVRI